MGFRNRASVGGLPNAVGVAAGGYWDALTTDLHSSETSRLAGDRVVCCTGV